MPIFYLISILVLLCVEYKSRKNFRYGTYNAWGKVMAHQVTEYAALAQVSPISGETYSSVSDA